MAYNGQFGSDDGFYQTEYTQNQGYDVGAGFGAQDSQFASFDYSQSQGYETSMYNPPQGGAYTGSIMTPDPIRPHYQASSDYNSFEDEPPLLEELGINFDHILQKTMAVLNPTKDPGSEIMQDTDLAGPLVFCLAFGGALLLAGKVQFGYIYGLGLVGCLAMYFLLNMMSLTGTSIGVVVSVLGYCLLPMVIMSFVAVVLSLKGVLGMVLSGMTVAWCSFSASKLFVSSLAMDQQQLLVAYPCALVYGVFALLSVF